MPSPLETTLHHIRHLSETIGPRGSCTPQVRQAGEYAAGVLRASGLQDVRFEAFKGTLSTYDPFVSAFSASIAAVLLGFFWGGDTFALAFAALVSGLAAWAMLAETDFSMHWARWFSNRAKTQNLLAVIPPAGERRHKAVLCAHLDTHRTPAFYSSPRLLRHFSLLLGAIFASLVLGFFFFGLAALLGWQWGMWLGVLLASLQVFGLLMIGRADQTPFTPGANDNASGVGVALALAGELQAAPLEHTEVTVLLTDCEETGAWGVRAYLKEHAAGLGQSDLFIALDQVGAGSIKFLSADGLILKHRTHPLALALARQAAAALPQMKSVEMTGLAYTDALPVTKRGLPALTLYCVIDQDPETGMHWHKMSDTLAHIEEQALEDTLAFTRQVLAGLDALSAPAAR